MPLQLHPQTIAPPALQCPLVTKNPTRGCTALLTTSENTPGYVAGIKIIPMSLRD